MPVVSVRSASTREARRVAMVVVLLVVTVIGLRARGTFSRAPDSAAAGATGAVLATVLIAGEGVAVVAFVVTLVAARRQRVPRKEEEPERLLFPWWAETLGVLLAVAFLATPPVVLFTSRIRKHTPVPPALAHLAHPVSGASPSSPAASPAWPLIAGMVIAIAVVLAAVLLTRRRPAAGRARNRVSPVTALAEGLAAGSAALQANREPRAAIIACYAAMEQGFAAAGSAPAAADTPAEVLARATGAGIVRPGPAELLTGLFRRARYSAGPITSADSAAAAAALAQLRDALDAPEDLVAPGARP